MAGMSYWLVVEEIDYEGLDPSRMKGFAAKADAVAYLREMEAAGRGDTWSLYQLRPGQCAELMLESEYDSL